MNTRLLALINEQQSGLKSQLDTIQSQAERLLSYSGAELKQLRSEFVGLLQKLEEQNDDAASVSSAESSAHPELFNSLNEISSSLSRLEGLMRTTPKEIRILEHLYFEGIFNRLDSIEMASENTFEWIWKSDIEYRTYLKSSNRRALDSSSSEDASEDSSGEFSENTDFESHGAAMKYTMSHRQQKCMDDGRRLFQEWLSGDGGIFHVSGKAGCGKSTLLKLIVGHDEITEALKRWAGKHKLIVASFFFWRSDGDKFQMTLDGMRRSILFLHFANALI
ncbi:hypothetical protein CGMCC3_g4067 [Colletotrichum fructicola]|uniref:Nephrocystin 3-like N-terminal domain-containing protein n=1 Tax=Colletotrichum fructicola (strain Nara gc5) TaxID=1213859 RepID=A0A7J6JDA0_COLFN|nr:uncharacterized protein CGMCC3_g4067 [Colletotrichum fructicola]KAF4487136.1 hypothetical protein CGGC5_v006326 [Colletotrichum fructicola Nara gc5]KAE9579820.1 hypothetical protein CGMCC3_g4067 [Colletotrichum fructicola]KAF4429262.1 hypothetical protein CFRS1_v006936 [Colletotrichum fructicola]KAF4883896.1 hypothetical protein CGCFRS4_v013184 [Colletotrichum fructicola]KAF5485544.1 hypothetical protein CGCF413_v013900 [Colletotrichum fructicola]